MTATPHDALFKAVFRRPKHAAEELRHVLPADVVQEIDWSTLTLASSEHVDPALEQSRGDLLFTASIGGRPGHIFFLLEHQSTQDHRMPLRLEHLPDWREPLTEILRGPDGGAWFLRLLRYVSVVMEELQFEQIR